MADQRLHYLFDKFLKKTCSSREVEELVNLLQKEEATDALMPHMHEVWEQIKSEQKEYPVDWQKIYQQITSQEKPASVVKRMSTWRIAAAIAGLIVCVAAVYLWSQHRSKQVVPSTIVQAKQDVPPGGNKAILTLGNGSTIELNRKATGTLTRQGNFQVVKLDSGELAYLSSGNSDRKGKVEYNSLATPRGGQYQLRLPDGTKVWLNASSSIRYPTAFTAKQRLVEVKGEVYFEVAKNAEKPFVVRVGDMRVHVLGTHFNVNAYRNEAYITTTLLEGKVSVGTVRSPDNTLVLVPGQTASLNKEGEMRLNKNADLDEVVGWKNGLFVFHHDDLPAIMRRLSRWYDIQVEYKNGIIPANHFTGTIRRSENISKVLKMLELTGGAHFEIKGRKVIVST